MSRDLDIAFPSHRTPRLLPHVDAKFGDIFGDVFRSLKHIFGSAWLPRGLVLLMGLHVALRQLEHSRQRSSQTLLTNLCLTRSRSEDTVERRLKPWSWDSGTRIVWDNLECLDCGGCR